MEEQNELFPLPIGWTWSRLEDLVLNPRNDIVDGPFGSNLKASSYIEEGIPIIRLQNIDRCVFVQKNIKYISPQKAQQLNRHNFSRGDVVITKLGAPLGKACVVPENIEKGIIVADVVRLRPPEQFVSKKYLIYAINSDMAAVQLKKKTKGTTRPRVNLNHIRRLSIPLAPLNEQFRIVGKVEELFSFLDAGVESLRKVQAQLKRYRQAVLKYAFEGKLTEEWRRTHKDQIEPAQKLLENIRKERTAKLEGNQKAVQSLDVADLPTLPETWVWTTIGELETFIGSGITPKGGKRVYVSEGIRFIRSQNVHPDGLRIVEVAHVTPHMHEEMKRTHTCPNDVLLNITGASIGRSTYIPEEFPEANVNQHVCIIRTGGHLFAPYLSHFLNSAYGQAQIFSTQSGVTRQGLNYLQVRNLRIPFAPLTEQKLIVEKIEETYSIAFEIDNSAKQNVKLSLRLRESVLKDAFAGKLVPQDPHDESAEKLLERIKAERFNKGKTKRNMQLELSNYVK